MGTVIADTACITTTATAMPYPPLATPILPPIGAPFSLVECTIARFKSINPLRIPLRQPEGQTDPLRTPCPHWLGSERFRGTVDGPALIVGLHGTFMQPLVREPRSAFVRRDRATFSLETSDRLFPRAGINGSSLLSRLLKKSNAGIRSSQQASDRRERDRRFRAIATGGDFQAKAAGDQCRLGFDPTRQPLFSGSAEIGGRQAMSTEHVFGTGKCGVEELDLISGAAFTKTRQSSTTFTGSAFVPTQRRCN